jgi:hypothetical protein
MTDETPQATIFRRMAARLDHNADAVFAGAAVIVPPAEGGDTVEMLILDSSQSAAQFWGALSAKCQIEISKLNDSSRNTQAFGRGR